jgi:anti-anti-sigma factor
MKLTLVSSEGGVARLRCEGEISATMAGANPLEAVLGERNYGGKVLVDLERATSINSTGVAWLVRCHKNFEAAGGCLVFHSIPPTIDHVLRLLNMPSLLRIANDKEEALNLVASTSA